MPQATQLAEIFTVLCCGLFSGIALYVSLVERPANTEAGAELAVEQFAPSYRRGVRMQAFLAILGSSSAVLVWLRSGKLLWLGGAALLFLLVPLTLIVTQPTYRQLLDPSLDRSSERARMLLTRWGRLHAVRAIVGLVALVLFFLLIVDSGK